jgi:hypothetical protein
MDVLKDIGLLGISIIVGVVGWLLKQKDQAQEKEIDLLWKKHDEDATALSTLKERVDREYYAKSELDTKMNAIRTEVHDGFRKIEDKIDKLIDSMIACHKKP